MSRSRSSGWFERNPGIAISVAISVPIMIGLLLTALFTRSLRLVRWITLPVAIVAALMLSIWWISAWLLPRVQARPRWAAAARRISLLLVVAMWGAIAFGFWQFDEPGRASHVVLFQFWWLATFRSGGWGVAGSARPVAQKPAAPVVAS